MDIEPIWIVLGGIIAIMMIVPVITAISPTLGPSFWRVFGVTGVVSPSIPELLDQGRFLGIVFILAIVAGAFGLLEWNHRRS